MSMNAINSIICEIDYLYEIDRYLQLTSWRSVIISDLEVFRDRRKRHKLSWEAARAAAAIQSKVLRDGCSSSPHPLTRTRNNIKMSNDETSLDGSREQP